MSTASATPVVYGTSWCPDCHRAKQFLGEQRIQYQWVDIEHDIQAAEYVERVNNGKRRVPTIVFSDGSVLTVPTNAELATKLGIVTRGRQTFYEVIVIGGGPAGLTAAMYLAREGVETMVVEKGAPGGQAGLTQMLENFPGFDEGITGAEFARRLTLQATRFGVEIVQAQEVTTIRECGRYREVVTADGTVYAARAVLITAGAHYKRLGVPGEEELLGINIHFCATCDGAFYKGKKLLVIGGGNSGFEEGLFLTRFATQVDIVEHNLVAKASRILQDKVAEQTMMSVTTNHDVSEFLVEKGRLSGVRMRDRATGEVKEVHPDGVFVFIGMSPNSGFLPAEVERNRFGFVVTDGMLQTSMSGVFAAGDIRAGATAQAASAAGEGAAAALMIRNYLIGH